MPQFADLGVPEDLVAALRRSGIGLPFPIQAATLPDSLAGRDLCGRAPTGSGKTLAFGIPMVARISAAKPHRPTGLVLVPTRELARQVQTVLVPLARARRHVVLAVYGGAPFGPQVDALRRGAAIVVACPGRLTDLIEQGLVDLSAVEAVVIDEADRLADMGFMPQVRALLDRVPKSRQTTLWSATLDGDVDTLVRRYQTNPARHEWAPPAEDMPDVAHHFWSVDPTDRVGVASGVLRAHRSGIVFCRTRHGADRVTKQLEAAGVPSAPIHGARSQAQRERALEAFRGGKVAALVATDVAARGIHVDGVGVVVHWDPPADAKDYVHRSGRTGRAGASGTVVTLAVPTVRKAVRDLQKALDLPMTLAPPDGSDGPPFAARTHTGPSELTKRPDRRPRRPAGGRDRSFSQRGERRRPDRSRSRSGTAR